MEKDKQEVLFRREHHDIREKIDAFMEQVRDELDDHRTALNENTNEIESNYELLNQLAVKLDKLNERLDELTMLVKHGRPEAPAQDWKLEPLTGQEKEAFFALYTITETTPYITYHQLARKLATTVEAVSRTITSLIGKGVPVEKKYANGNAFLGLDKAFREAQAKHNLVKLDTKLTYWAGQKQ